MNETNNTSRKLSEPVPGKKKPLWLLALIPVLALVVFFTLSGM